MYREVNFSEFQIAITWMAEAELNPLNGKSLEGLPVQAYVASSRAGHAKFMVHEAVVERLSLIAKPTAPKQTLYPEAEAFLSSSKVKKALSDTKKETEAIVQAIDTSDWAWDDV